MHKMKEAIARLFLLAVWIVETKTGNLRATGTNTDQDYRRSVNESDYCHPVPRNRSSRRHS